VVRNYLILVVVLAVIGSMMGRAGPHSMMRDKEPVAQAGEAPDSGPARPQYDSAQSASQDGTVEIDRSPDGHFYADVQINGAPVRMLIDTGATGVALSREDARSAGVATSIGMNDVVGRGADGDVHGEIVTLDRMELGDKRVEGVEAIIFNSGEQSLLGQSFLKQFSSVEIQGDRMVLR
jgi:aspartyl protease family protein